MVIYVDVLIILNLYINYFLIRAAALVLRRDISARRCLAAAAAGAVAALAALLPELPFWAAALIKSASGAGIVIIAFGRQKKADFAISLLCFLLISFLFAGAMLALWTFLAPFDMVLNNGVAYFNIPIAAIAAFTAVAYGAVRAVRYFSDRRIACQRICSVVIAAGGRTVALRGLADTGNGLCDIYSGKPAVICRREAVEAILPTGVREYLDGKPPTDGVRLIPCETVAASALIPIFTADSITVSGKPASAVVGVSPRSLGEDADCIFNPCIISL